MNKIRNGIVMILLLCLLCGCSFAAEKEEDSRDLAYTVVSEDGLPTELKDLIEAKKAEPFKMTYEDQGYLYIVQGFGQKPTGGFSIQLQELYETGNAIYFSALLIGPEEQNTPADSFPYIVVKTEYQEKTVVFNS